MDVRRVLRRLPRAVVCAVVAAGAACAPALAQAPPNDNFVNARPLQYGSVDGAVGNTDATVESGEAVTCTVANGDSTAVNTVWWVLMGSGRPVTLTTDGSNFDTTLAITPGGGPGDVSGACDDSDPTETISNFATTAGQVYHVEVGGCGPQSTITCGNAFGQIHLLATTPLPGNDNRGAATPLATGSHVQGDTFGATQEPGETLTCQTSRGPSPFGATVWYRWHAPSAGSAVFTAVGAPYFDTVLAVYGGDSRTPAGCDDDAVLRTTSRVAMPVQPGDYLLQVGGFDPYAVESISAGEGPMTVDAEFTPAPAPAPAPHPAPAPAATAPLSQKPAHAVTARLGLTTYVVHTDRRYTVMRLIASRVSAGTRIVVRCRGGGCPFAARAMTARKAYARLALGGRAMRRARLRKGAVVEVRASKPGLLGRVTTYRIRAARLPVLSSHCTLPGSLKETACPA